MELDRLLANDEVVMVGPVLTEVLQGADSDAEFAFYASRLIALPFLEADQATWVRAAELNFQLMRQGLRLSLGDLMISTLALYHDIPVYSLNGDFNRVSGLRRHGVDAQ